jgi:hypothetical protein
MKTNFLENNWVVHCAPASVIDAAEDIGDGSGGTNILCDVMSLANADGAVFIVTTMANAGGTSSFFCLACDNVTPSTTVAVSFRYTMIAAPNTILATGEATSYKTSTAADIVYVFEVDAAKVAEQGYKFIRLEGIQSDNAAIDGAIVGFLTGLRYKEDNIGTQVA